MAAIARHPVEIAGDCPQGGTPWPAFAAQCRRWAHDRGLALRDCIVLLPFAQLLPLAQQAFAAGGGWQPRVETTQSLARSLGPPAPAQPWQLSGDAALDRLTAARLLRGQSQGAEWARLDPRSFEHGVALLVQTAHELARAAAALAPSRRPAHWEAGRRALAPLPGPGARERWLARVALEWAAQAPAPATDRLWDCRPAAWMVLQAGGPDPLAEALLDAADAGVAALMVDADAALPAWSLPELPALARCPGFEQEARRAAALVLQHCAAGQTPVALVGQDRLVVRRVRALLERAGLQPVDETGWSLPTTRAAAQLMGLLRAAGPAARSDDLFDWLKTLPPGALAAPAQFERLEQACRRLGLARVADLARLPPGSAEAQTAAVVRNMLVPLAERRRPLADWLRAVRAVLEDCGAWPALQADEAGQALLRALRLAGAGDADPAWHDAAAATAMDLDELAAWVDASLDAATFQPAASHPEVVIVPMARLLLRPFAAVVWPGADDRQLGAPPAPHPLFDEATLRLLGLPDAAALRARERLLFEHALRLPRLSFLRRQGEGGEPLVDSPLLQRLALDLALQGRALLPAADPGQVLEVTLTLRQRPAPSAPGRLPAALSASAAEALRECPYRFLARHLLRLREDEELDDAVEKRDYGNWLHAVLLRFHAEREAPAPAAQEVARLLALAEQERHVQGLAEEVALPFSASLASLAPRYVDWLQRRDAEGARWQAGEQERRVPLPAVPGVELQGVIDRIDRWPDGTLELLDYKTGSPEGLKRKLRDAQEDTQLAFYAALLDPAGSAPLAAAYLPLDSSGPLKLLPHPQVAHSAQRLLHALGNELARVQAGAPLPALGEGSVCEYCEARGLCRRDHWGGP